MFYTRIPCPKWVGGHSGNLTQATRYFPLIGWIVGAISGGVLVGLSYLFPVSVSIVLSILSGIFITGAFHEDGLADVCDGFGGGWTKAKILEIMKDSRNGTYGTIGLISILGLKFFILYEIFTHIPHTWWIIIILISSHSLSRWMAALMVYTHDYVREDAHSKAKPIAEQLSIINLLLAGLWTLPALALLTYILSPWILIIPVLMWIMKLYLAGYFKKWIGGYTGDCLGATQQITEIVFYLGFYLILKNS